LKTVNLNKKNWSILLKHSIDIFPQECTGMFECIKIKSKPLKITKVFPCRNVSSRKKYGSQISKIDMRRLRPILISGAKNGFLYGVYHSHPNTGTIQLSDEDMFCAKLYKRFRLQVIIGITKKNKIRRAFWQMNKSGWSLKKIIVK
jgi:proteasome lid subunit RPN8/RPN11